MLGGLLIAAAATVHVSELKTFKDWVVGCDNGLLCQASAMMPESDVSATLTVRRMPEGAAAPEVWLRTYEGDVADVSVDGKKLGLHLKKNHEDDDDDAYVVVPTDAMRLLDALRAAKKVAVIDPDGKEGETLLVDGATAALLYMDDRQHRLGTVGALVNRGNKPNSAVPPPPSLPIVYTVRGSAKPPAAVSPVFIAKVRKDNDCENEKDPNQVSVDRLDDRHTFVSIELECQSGAYNYFSANYVIPDGAAPQEAKFEDDTSKEDGDLHFNLFWDSKERRLDGGMKGRGIGDCGGKQEYVWDGAMFRVVKIEQMDDCRGVMDFITTWRARVVER